MSDTQSSVGRSPSVDQALLWAEASAALRGPGRQVTETDLFLGTLLAHPNADGEMRRLLGHFGLTARDLLPDDFPQVTPDNLRHAAARVGTADPASHDIQVVDDLSMADSLSSGSSTQLVHVIGALLLSTSFQQMLQRGLERSGVQASQLAQEYSTFLSVLDLKQIAGRQLGEWLTQRFPRRPATMAAFNSERVDPRSDFVGVGVEADAFAYLVSSRTLVPPLAVGLFGEWGSGKSFLMAKIRHRIGQLTELAQGRDHETAGVWANIAHIEFNAWQYVETNLWAALLHRIFAELTPEARLKLSQRRRAETAKAIDSQAQTVVEAESVVTSLQEEEQKQAGTLQQKQARVEQVQLEYARIRDAQVAQVLEATARTVLVGRTIAASQELLGQDPRAQELASAVAAAGRAAAAARTSPWLNAKFWTPRRVLYVAGATLAVPVVGYLVETWLASAFAAVMASLAALIPLAVGGLKVVVAFAAKQQTDFEAAERAVDEKLAAALAQVQEDLNSADDQLRCTRTKLAEAMETAEKERDRRTELEQEHDAQTAGNLLATYVSDRNASEDYRSQLSLVSTVNRDLSDLDALTREYNAEHPRDPDGPPNRIVLYIDDLDRCPPNRVVDVLEAVHLLLSFELFVVVVAVDTRWLNSALISALPSLLQDAETGEQPTGPQVGPAGPQDEIRGKPGAQDYLEKIFQVPFWVERLDDPARQRLLRGLLLPSVAAQDPNGTTGDGKSVRVDKGEEELISAMLTDYGVGLDLDARQLSITPDEFAFLESLAPLIGGTPRRVKRFVNICLLLLAMAPPLSAEGDQPTERMATCFMAAVHEGLPRLAERLAKSPIVPSGGPTTLLSALNSLGPDELAAEKERLNNWLEQRARVQSSGTVRFELTPMTRFLARFDTIRRLRFEVNPV